MRMKEMLVIFIFSISVFLQNSVLALDCPKFPEQFSKNWEVEVNAAVAKIGPVTGSELQTRTRNATQDLLGRLPDAGPTYLEQMMYAAYCSGLRDDKSLSETEKSQRLREYNSEVRNTIAGHSSVRPPSKQEALKEKEPSVSSSKHDLVISKGASEQDKRELQVIEKAGFSFTLQECKHSGGNLICRLLIKNLSQDQRLSLIGLGSRVFDESGNEYKATNLKLGNDINRGGWGVDKMMVFNIPVMAEIQFDKVPSEVNFLTLLEINIAGGSYNSGSVQFRDIPLK